MHIKKPFLLGLLLTFITILIDGFLLRGIKAYIDWDNSFIVDTLWDFYILCMFLLSMTMSLLMGNVPGVRIQVMACIALHALLWILLLYNFSYFIHKLTVLRIVTTEVANTAFLFLLLRRRVSPSGCT
jgi:hypothetical protein